jgi:hypothetical protein
MKRLRLALWRSRLYLFIRRMVFKAQVRKEKEEQRWDHVSQERENYKYHAEIHDICLRRGIPVIFMNLNLKGLLTFLPELDRLVKERGLSYIRLELDPSLEPDVVSYAQYHPGPKNNLIIAEELLKLIEKKKLIPGE